MKKTFEVRFVEYIGLTSLSEELSEEDVIEESCLLVSVPFGVYTQKSLLEFIKREANKNKDVKGIEYTGFYSSTKKGFATAISLLRSKTVEKNISEDPDTSNLKNYFMVGLFLKRVNASKKSSEEVTKEFQADKIEVDKIDESDLIDVSNFNEEDLHPFREEDYDYSECVDAKINRVWYNGYGHKESFYGGGEDGDFCVHVPSGNYSIEGLKAALQKGLMDTDYAPDWSAWKHFENWDPDLENILNILKFDGISSNYSHTFTVFLQDYE